VSSKNPSGNYVDSDSYAIQLFIPRHIKKWKGVPKKFPPAARHPNNKPAGAFWTSTLAGNTSDWDEWMKGEMPEWRGSEGVVLGVKPGARIRHLRTKQQAEDFLDEYGVETPDFPSLRSGGGVWTGLFEKVPDWPRVYRDYDAMHMEGAALRHPAFYGWDAESTGWWNTKHLKDIGRVVLEVD